MTETISYLELLFTTIGAIGLAVLLYGVPEILGDLGYARTKRQLALPNTFVALEVRYRTALANIRREAGRIISLVGCVALGLQLMTRPASPSSSGRPSFTLLLFTTVIIVMEANITLQSIMDRIDRHLLVTAIIGPRRSLEEAVAAEVQHRRRADDPPPDMDEDLFPGT